MHLRKEIKSKFVDLLTRKKDSKYQTLAEDRVYKNRFIPLDNEDESYSPFPAICVFCISEDNAEVNDLQDRRTAEIVVECIANGPSADDNLDTLSNQVELILSYVSDGMEDLTERIRLTKTEIGIDQNSDSSVQAVRLTYSVPYIVDSTCPADNLDTWNTAGIDYKIGTNSIDSSIEIP